MADEPEDDDFDDLSLPDFDEEIQKASLEVDEEEEDEEDEGEVVSLLEQAAILENAPTAKNAPKVKPKAIETPENEEETPAPTLTTAPAPIEGSRNELDFSLTVELGRVSIPMNKLLDLEQGHVLELGVSADQGVDLVIGGRCIGRGELVKIGPKIAVRILSIK